MLLLTALLFFSTVLVLNQIVLRFNHNYESILQYMAEIKKKYLDNFILDESFIHFAYEDLDLSQVSFAPLIKKYKNLSIVKSMSKDFGIAGIRCGYGIMSEDKVKNLLKIKFVK